MCPSANGTRTSPTEFAARADFTSEVAESNPDWKIDLNDEVIGRGAGRRATSPR